MKIAYLTAGPRGAGKSTYVSMVRERSPGVLVVDRDEFFVREFGANSFDPYSGMHIVGAEFFRQEIKNVIKGAEKNAKIIIDAWNGFLIERIRHIRYLRELGVDLIVCWYFVTPLAACLEWFKQKPGCASISECSVKWDWELYHEKAADINYPNHEIYHSEIDDFNSHETFDMICRINPLQLTFPNINLV